MTAKIAALTSLVIGSGMFQFVLAWGQHEPAAQPGRAAQKQDERTELLKSRAEAAKKAYDGASDALKHTRISGRDPFSSPVVQISTPADVYRWSVRFLEAQKDLSDKKEQRIAAAAAHLQRMEKLKKQVNNLTMCLLPRFEQNAAEYYRVEAEIWLAQEKAR